ncbi:hypothetical protein QR98_0104080 [Sarcoptes scabiei]|uniref:Uncharacterized protein n=1 Tax=Sarcoptes scabiei TaxID=52283 RepID=A0A132ALE6_SARSC|nr:hypothetical protein QR98_0104080 [Sarcoptes scabiei]
MEYCNSITQNKGLGYGYNKCREGEKKSTESAPFDSLCLLFDFFMFIILYIVTITFIVPVVLF